MNPSLKALPAIITRISIYFLLICISTGIIFYAFVPESKRYEVFYISLGLVIAGELVLFSHWASAKISQTNKHKISDVTRIHIHALISIWIISTIVTAYLVFKTSEHISESSIKIFAIEILLTSLFFVAANLVYHRDLEIGLDNLVIVEAQKQKQLDVMPIDDLLYGIQCLGAAHKDLNVRVDEVKKKINSIRGSVDSRLISENDVSVADQSVYMAQIKTETTSMLSVIQNADTGLSLAQAQSILQDIENRCDKIINIIKRNSMLFYRGD